MKNFVMKYGKWIAVAVAVITFGLLAIPGFLKLAPHSLNGYEMIFRAKLKYNNGDWFNYLKSNGNYDVCVIGIIALVCTLFSGVSITFDKKSSALDILGGILMLFSALVFFAMQGWAIICYKRTNFSECGVGPVAYIIGALQLIAGAAMTYKGFTLLKQEKSDPKSMSYSYLKKNK